jgi:hypothetical protein
VCRSGGAAAHDPQIQIARYNGSSLQDCRAHSCDEKADFRPLEFVNELKNGSEDQFAIQRSSGVMTSACAWRSRPFSSRWGRARSLSASA